MPSTDYRHRIQGLKMTRRQVLQLAVVAGGGLAGMLLVGCGSEEKSA
jgi:hypothetical protein